MNYIVPILTKGYISRINGIFNDYDNKSLDSKYARYIFSLFRDEYIQNDCVNNRVRYVEKIILYKVNELL